jgi:hypothetical protein
LHYFLIFQMFPLPSLFRYNHIALVSFILTLFFRNFVTSLSSGKLARVAMLQLGEYTQLRHHGFLPHRFSLLFIKPSCHSTLCNLRYW